MCGIAGLWSPQAPVDDGRAIIARMLGYLRHRGPDEMGYVVGDRVALGTARLCVIDLETGQQPLSDDERRSWIAYNGEVYNYVELRTELTALGHAFRTTSDTEVVLRSWLEWGTESLARLNGGFAFAIYDARADTLCLARDRYGKRPLFTGHAGATLVFGSEIKCLLGCPGVDLELDPASLASIFGTWTPIGAQTPFRGVRQVPAGCVLLVDAAGERLHRYAPVGLVTPAFEGSADDAVARTRTVLERSVRLRLRSDVEVGTYLSGGLDSAIVTAIAHRLSPGMIQTFSIAFEDERFDESEWQEQLSRHFGTRHHVLRIGASAIGDAFPDALWHAEVPVFRTAFVPMFLLSGLVRDAGIKVVLTGEGADESFLGYNLFKETLLRARWDAGMDQAEKESSVGSLYPYLAHFGPENRRALAGLFDRFAADPDDALFSHEIRFHTARFAQRLLRASPDPLAALRGLIAQEDPEFGRLTGVRRAQWIEFRTLLSGYLLATQGDRASFAHGVEARCPFLDPAVVRLAASLPRAAHLSDALDEKRVLKQAYAAELPSFLTTKAKRPYLAPDASVFLGDDAPEYVDLVRSATRLDELGVVDTKFAARFLAKLDGTPPDRISPRENQAFLLLLSLALLHWMFVGAGRRPPSDITPLLVREEDLRTSPV